MNLPPKNTLDVQDKDTTINGNGKALKPDFDFSSIKKDGITSSDIKEEETNLLQESEKAKEAKGMFLIKPANQWINEAKAKPIPDTLFDSFWSEEEICILFADSGLGKSILSIQIADSISTGKFIPGFAKSAKAQKVLCFDLELTDKMFEKRYSNNYQNHYVFSPDFYRVEINPDAFPPDGQSFQEYLDRSLEMAIKETEATVVIVDNLTYLRNETERAKDALPLMKQLKTLKSRYSLSVLALAHTPKRDNTRPISSNDLAGSRNLYNFTDTCFAIGASEKDKAVRYIKQLKPRNTELMYGTDNVIVCQIAKPDNFLGFEFMGYGLESEHLKQLSDTDRREREQEAAELHQKGVSNREIARQMGVSEGAIRKWLRK